MRSPLGAWVPSRLGQVILGVAVLVLGACTGDETPVAQEPTPSASPLPTNDGRGSGGGDSAGGDVAPETEVRLSDKDSKRTVRGDAPAYVEIAGATVDGSVDRLVFGLTLAGPVPERMPDGHSVLRVTFTAVAAGGRRYTFEAQCVRPGWGTFASGGPEDAPIPEIAIRNKTIQLAVDPAYMGGLQPFDWLVNVAWTSGEANYAFDAAPKKGFASYP